MAGLSDLDFGPRLEIQLLVQERFSFLVSFSPTSSEPEFWLVASFGGSALHLNVESIGLILQSCLGGTALNFNVQHLSGCMFWLFVASKNVGFLVYRLRSHVCKLFALFFALWGNGGPNWQWEHILWLKEEEDEWTHVQ
uniref:Uncharacterized protein n=1 Tax=Setaria italica TaxID=4555 RepID=K3ZMM0_SETIT